jgi:hypothetical protein
MNITVHRSLVCNAVYVNLNKLNSTNEHQSTFRIVHRTIGLQSYYAHVS